MSYYNINKFLLLDMSYKPSFAKSSFNKFTSEPSSQIHKSNKSTEIFQMINVINTANVSDILSFFESNIMSGYIDSDNNTPIHLIVQTDNQKLDQINKIHLIQILIKYPFNISFDSPNKHSFSPLYIAIIKQYDKIVKCLLLLGADAKRLTFNHQNALHLAILPNIMNCEQKITPESIIKFEANSEDKNIIYNQALSIFANHRNLYADAIKNLKLHIEPIDNFYSDWKNSNLTNNNSELFESDTPIDKLLKEFQNTIQKQLINSSIDQFNFDKTIGFQCSQTILRITAEYENFIKPTLIDINTDNKDFVLLNDTNIINITDRILNTNQSKYKSHETEHVNTKTKYRNLLYTDIDRILKLLYTGHNFDRTKNIPSLGGGGGVSNPPPLNSINDKHNNEICMVFGIDPNNPNNPDYEHHLSLYSAFVNNQQKIPNIKLAISSNDHNHIINQIRNYAINVLTTINYSENPSVNPTLLSKIRNNLNNILDRFVNGLPGPGLDLDRIIQFIKTNPLVTLAIMRTNINFGLNSITLDKLKKVNDILNLKYSSKTKDIYNAIINLNLYKSEYSTDDIFYKNIIQYYNLLISNGDNGGLKTLRDNNDFEIYVMTNINDIIVGHISYLNANLGLINLNTINPIDMLNLNIYHTYPNISKLEYFKFDNPIGGDDHNYRIAKYDFNQFNYKNNVINQINPNPLIGNISFENIKFVANSFAKSDIPIIDYLNLFKKRFIKWWIENSVDNSKVLFPIFDQIKNIIEFNIDSPEKLNDQNITLETTLLIVKIIDRLFIQTVRFKIYLIAVQKLKQNIFNISNSVIITNYLDQILHVSNRSLKLDKKLNDMVVFNNLDKHQSIIDKISPLTKLIIDDKIITNIFEPLNSESNIIYRYDMDSKSMGNYIVYYPPDYKSLNLISSRKCIYNTTLVLETILTYAKSYDYLKIDINGFSPIFYAIQSGNYLLIQTIMNILSAKSVDRSKILNQINPFGQTPLTYAYECICNCLNMIPDYPMLNITFINNLLLSGAIANNLPNEYRNNYKYVLYDINEFLNDPKYDFFLIYKIMLNQSKIPNINNNQTDKLTYKYANVSLHNKLKIALDKVSDSIQNYKFTSDDLIDLRTETNLIFDKEINHLKELVDIFEQKYHPRKLYKYQTNTNNTPNRPINVSNIKSIKYIKSSNDYYVRLIALGIKSIKKLIETYYLNVILAQLNTINVFNIDFDDIDGSNIVNQIERQIRKIIVDFTNLNIFDLVRIYYNIKLDQFDDQIYNQTIIDDFFTKLLNKLSLNGIFKLDSVPYINIKQHINAHMIELISKTLQFNQVMLDVIHRWIVNYYYFVKTFKALIN